MIKTTTITAAIGTRAIHSQPPFHDPIMPQPEVPQWPVNAIAMNMIPGTTTNRTNNKTSSVLSNLSSVSVLNSMTFRSAYSAVIYVSCPESLPSLGAVALLRASAGKGLTGKGNN